MKFVEVIRFLSPRVIKKQLKSIWVLLSQYGQNLTFIRSRCVDKNGNELPWYTYPAIEYLGSLDFTEFDVLEYGSGASSIWWSKRARQVISVEHNKEWFDVTKNISATNLEVIYAPEKPEYLIPVAQKKFNIVIIDGVFRHECAKNLNVYLRDESLVILDNSDWHSETAKYLREAHNFIQVDFHGFGPINDYTWTTSLFFSRSFRTKPKEKRLPSFSLGAIKQTAKI